MGASSTLPRVQTPLREAAVARASAAVSRVGVAAIDVAGLVDVDDDDVPKPPELSFDCQPSPATRVDDDGGGSGARLFVVVVVDVVVVFGSTNGFKVAVFFFS